MTRIYCDRCGAEITLEPYLYFVQLYSEIHRKDLGLKPQPVPDRVTLCGLCWEKFKAL